MNSALGKKPRLGGWVYFTLFEIELTEQLVYRNSDGLYSQPEMKVEAKATDNICDKLNKKAAKIKAKQARISAGEEGD